MTLKGIPFKAVYRSETDNILSDFYVPALRQSKTYDRAVGYFSAAMLSYAAQGLSVFVKQEGTMRLIFGGEISPEDATAMHEGYRLKELADRFGDTFLKTIGALDDSLFQRRLELLAWLVANGRLQIKVALKRRGMYHEKIGVFTDSEENQVIFQGSANETANALLPDFNFESINVFPSWRPELRDHYEPYLEGFERLWSNKSPNTLVLEFPQAAREKLLKIAADVRQLMTPEIETHLTSRLKRHEQDQAQTSGAIVPRIPKQISGRDFVLFEHQRKALYAWKAHEYRGILELATGAGKTVTALYGATKYFEARKRLFLIIAVPYQNLGDQWLSNCQGFGFTPIACYGHRESWESDLIQAVGLYQAGAISFCAAVVVNRTLTSDAFQSVIANIEGDTLLFVGDECHHHSSTNLNRALPNHARLRLGLSATPDIYGNPAGTAALTSYYGSIVHSYGLGDALSDKVLTPYKYYVHEARLNEAEAERYNELTRKISSLVAAGGGLDGGYDGSDTRLRAVLMERARLLGSASDKLTILRSILRTTKPTTHSLFYCGDGSVGDDPDSDDNERQIELVSQILHEFKWSNSHFTSRESRADREQILDQFRLGFVSSLVAIRCLDEGIDVPACRLAFILASGRNPRQFIQRRGRILRRSEGKEYAEIHDFVVTNPFPDSDDDKTERTLVTAELARVAEFANLASNRAQVVRELMPLLTRLDVAHLLA